MMIGCTKWAIALRITSATAACSPSAYFEYPVEVHCFQNDLSLDFSENLLPPVLHWLLPPCILGWASH